MSDENVYLKLNGQLVELRQVKVSFWPRFLLAVVLMLLLVAAVAGAVVLAKLRMGL